MCVSKTADLSPSFLDNLVATLDRQHRESVKILGQQWLVSKFQIPTDLHLNLSKFYGPPHYLRVSFWEMMLSGEAN